METLEGQLVIERCPHCNIDKPNLNSKAAFETRNYDQKTKRFWKAYSCNRCGGVVIAYSFTENGEVHKIYPKPKSVNENIPNLARNYLQQAIDSIHAPAGSLMLCASSVDSMLKAKSYKDGNLYKRIDEAAKDHLITMEMSKWAHKVRLDANEQRHTDEKISLPTSADAQKCIEFVLALGEFLFVLPAKVERGLKQVSTNENATE